uniref:Uncharacterized protein n=1 Tax=Lotus japonicus TaxID=34305 RepID=I3SXM5_LOTJA|nr:unknown [Lotus japonicus]
MGLDFQQQGWTLALVVLSHSTPTLVPMSF